MNGLGNTLLSLLAVCVSCVTTYFTMFHERASLNAAVARVSLQTQIGSGRGDAGLSASYRRYAALTVILANDGNRPLVVTDASLVGSTSAEGCAPSETILSPLTGTDPAEPILLAPGSVMSTALEFALPAVDAEFAQAEPSGAEIAALNKNSGPQTWCLRATIFDQAGVRHEPMMRALTLVSAFAPGEDTDDAPRLSSTLDYPREAIALLP